MAVLGALALSLWLGILTSVSPCPLTSNIAAISYLSRNITNSRLVFIRGFLYTLGRSIAYVLLAGVIALSVVSIPDVSIFLQKYFNKIIGPVLILIGMIVLNLIKLPAPRLSQGKTIQKIVDKHSFGGALAMGIVFAFSFCPVSAAFFFGSLLPLAVTYDSVVLFPSFYGIGTALPVFLFVCVLSCSSSLVAGLFAKITIIELWSRRITGTLLIIIGVYFSINYIFIFA